MRARSISRCTGATSCMSYSRTGTPSRRARSCPPRSSTSCARRELRLALHLLGSPGGRASGGAGVRRRRCDRGGAGKVRGAASDVSLPLGAERSVVLYRPRRFSGGGAGRRIHCLPWLLEPRPAAAGRLQRRVRAVRGWRARGRVGGVRRRRLAPAGKRRNSTGRWHGCWSWRRSPSTRTAAGQSRSSTFCAH
jgi:hypothetical protein